jgi:hypothetical protein
MKVERVRPRVFQLTLHAYELAAFVAAARWAAEGGSGELEPDAVEQLHQLLDCYEEQLAGLEGG